MIKPNVSIVSVTYRSLEDTRAFVESVYANTFEPFEFIMGVNGWADRPLKDYLVGLERQGRVRLVWNPANIGVRAFGQVMRLAQAPFIFRCDSDIVIDDVYWTSKMRQQWEVSNKEIGDVVAVGTANTSGAFIRHSPNTTETDIILSNCMLIHAPTAQKMADKLKAELPRMEEHVAVRLAGGEFYAGEFGDLRATLDYARYHAPWWDVNFGGLDQSLGYGSDDMLWSILAKWAGLKMVVSPVKVIHRDASMRPDYASERHRLVLRAFQYFRTVLSLVMNEWRESAWNDMPNNLPILVDHRLRSMRNNTI